MAPQGDLRRLLLLLLLCLAAAGAGTWLDALPFTLPWPGDTSDELMVVVDHPRADALLRGLVRVSGRATDRRPGARLQPESLALFLDAPVSGLLGRPLVRLPRDAPQVRAEFELGWETCTFAPGPYTLRAQARSDDGAVSSDTLAVDVGTCPTPPLAPLRQDDLHAASSAWPAGATACLQADYGRAGYRLVRALSAPGACGVWDSAHVVYGDFVLLVEAELPHQDRADGALVAFRASPTGDSLTGYAALIEPAPRRLSLLRYEADRPPQTLARAALDVTDPFYAVEILAVSDLLSVRVNGQAVLLARDAGPRWGRVYLGVTGDDAGATVLYRDLALRRAPGPSNEAVARRPDR